MAYANLTPQRDDIALIRAGNSAAAIVLAAAPLPVFDGQHALIGSWVITGQPAGIGMREDRAPITTNASRFVPHYFA